MNPEVLTTILIAMVGMIVSWAVWVSVSVFKHAQELALIKQELLVLTDVKDVLEEIKLQIAIKHKEEQQRQNRAKS